MERILIQLGRYGDLINILPLAEEFARNSKRLSVMVSDPFIQLLEGVSYCDPLPYEGDYTYLKPAESLANSLCPRVRTSQCWAKDYQHTRTTDCFQKDSWDRLKFANRWDQSLLIFDRRDEPREQALVEQLLDWTNRKVVLLSLSSHSSPFPQAQELKAALFKDCSKDFLFVDISQTKAHRLYDLLGLFDRAECLITVDTSTLHLAAASSIPVIALVNSQPWLSSARRANHLLRLPYPRFDYNQVVKALYSTNDSLGRLRHVYSVYDWKGDDKRRIDLAQSSWGPEYNRYNWHPVPYTEEQRKKARPDQPPFDHVPFVKDMIDHAFSQALSNDAVVITNADIGFTPGMSRDLVRLLSCKGACYSYRRDFSPQLTAIPKRYEVHNSLYFGGLDLFAFTYSWWKAHRDDAPDMLLGRTHWDLVYRDLIKKYGGGELCGAVWHEIHEGFWKQVPNCPGNMYNLNLHVLWRTENDSANPYRFL